VHIRSNPPFVSKLFEHVFDYLFVFLLVDRAGRIAHVFHGFAVVESVGQDFELESAEVFHSFKLLWWSGYLEGAQVVLFAVKAHAAAGAGRVTDDELQVFIFFQVKLMIEEVDLETADDVLRIRFLNTGLEDLGPFWISFQSIYFWTQF
jgi:hypothetical protein